MNDEPIQADAHDPLTRQGEDAALIREAAALTRELSTAKPSIYWPDFLICAAIGYAALFWAAGPMGTFWTKVAASVVAVLFLYRASLFIHEITHMKRDHVPGFRWIWNFLVGIPMLIPSFLYEDTHNQHHSKLRYGTEKDPEYLPLASMKPHMLLFFMVVAVFGSVGFLLRFAILSPLSLLSSWVRRETVARVSTLAINPSYRRALPEGEFRRDWIIMETGAALWSIGVITAVVIGWLPLNSFLIYLAIVATALVLNQIRTLVAHLWENDGRVMSVTDQYLDSVNVPPPGPLAELWAPVGLRYHALHHLVPSVPYHNLPEAHRRLAAKFGSGSSYDRANYPNLRGLIGRLVASSFRGGPA
ncbi:fatty acid desaturase family protein [Sphingorhabdus sp.]|uniref:fatty acid desaturase family protein n=1 Tax=Sphingorhabdus sp. TaxID=1902408 RepID=UPI003BAF0C15